MDIPKHITQAVQKKNSTQLNPSLTTSYEHSGEGEREGFEISIYRQGELLENCPESEKMELFDRLRNGFTMNLDLLRDTFQIMKEEQWTKERVVGAYKHVLKTHVWNTDVKPAELLSYDKKVKFNTYGEICLNIRQYISIYYKGIKTPLYILRIEQEQFNFPLWDDKYRVESKLTDEKQIELCIKQDKEYKDRLRGNSVNE